jgi:hypothetical protein
MSDVKERGGATLVNQIKDSAIVQAVFPKVGVNYAIAIIMFLGGIFVDFPRDQVNDLTLKVFGAASGFQFLYTYFKNAKWNFLAWLKNENTWAAAFTLATTFKVVLPQELFTEVGNLVSGVIDKDIRVVLVSLGYLTTIIINLVRNNANRPTVAGATTT